jgi:hypothetical protein
VERNVENITIAGEGTITETCLIFLFRKQDFLRFDVLTAVTMNITIFSDMTSYSLHRVPNVSIRHCYLYTESHASRPRKW